MNDLQNLQKKIAELAVAIEKMKLSEYVRLLENPWRLLYVNFISGVARGFGMAVGFTILSALVIYVLQRLVILNLPLISDLIADIIRLVREQSY